ncbi:MAG TPA: response regulator [Kofleriaceae bacterium]
MSSPILVVDDDRDIRDSLRETLEDEGFAAADVGSGPEALDYLRAHPLTPLILLDWNMAPMDGPAFRAAIAAIPELASIPVIVLTADTRVLEKARGSDYAACLKKPVNLPRLFALVTRFCR